MMATILYGPRIHSVTCELQHLRQTAVGGRCGHQTGIIGCMLWVRTSTGEVLLMPVWFLYEVLAVRLVWYLYDIYM